MIINKLAPLTTIVATFALSACSTMPDNPISATPMVTKTSANSYDITVTGLPGKRSIDVERGFHEVADKACLTKAGWSGWKMQGGTSINPIKNAQGIFTASGTVVCSK